MKERPEQSDQSDDEIDFENRVGYGQPPKHSRWKKGFCPNPGGRPRKANSRKHYLELAANRLVTIKVGAVKKQVTTLEAIIEITKLKAIAGNESAASTRDMLAGIVTDQDEEYVRPGLLIAGEELTQEEWLEEYARHLEKGSC